MKGKTVRTIMTVLLAVMSVLVFVGCSTPPEQFSDYKKSAIKEIERYADSCVFDDEDKSDVYSYGILDECEELINAAENRDEVRTAVNNAKKKIDEIKIDISNRRAIPYENNRITGARIRTFKPIRGIIRSYTELEDFCATNRVYEDNKVITDQYDNEFFDKKALVIFGFSEFIQITRQIDNVYVTGDKLQVAMLSLGPGGNTLDQASYYLFTILNVDKSDIGDITDVAITSQYIVK